jgi:hypothetical protein
VAIKQSIAVDAAAFVKRNNTDMIILSESFFTLVTVKITWHWPTLDKGRGGNNVVRLLIKKAENEIKGSISVT